MLQKTVDIINQTNRKIGHYFAWLALAMVILMFINVICRYVFNTTLIWQQELVRFMHAILFLSAAGYTLLEDKHVRVDVLYHNFSDKTKALVGLIGTLIFLFPVCFAIIYFSTNFIIESWKLFEHSPEYNGMKGVFILKSFIWFFCFTLILQGVSTICQSIINLRRS